MNSELQVIFYMEILGKWGQIFVFDKMMYTNLSYFSDLKVLIFKEAADHIANMLYYPYSKYQSAN